MINGKRQVIIVTRRDKVNRPDHLGGCEGLVMAIISQAVNDLIDGNKDDKRCAEKYFLGELYANHLAWLGLPRNWMPDGIDVGIR